MLPDPDLDQAQRLLHESEADERRTGQPERNGPKVQCPKCGCWKSKVRESRADAVRGYMRFRVCTECGQAFKTFEKVA